MKYLVICPCGHSMDRHEQDGCGGDGGPCECVHTQEGALDADSAGAAASLVAGRNRLSGVTVTTAWEPFC